MQHQDQVDGLSALDTVWLLEALPWYTLQQFEAGNDYAKFSFSISKLLYDLYSKINGKDRLSVADRMRGMLFEMSWKQYLRKRTCCRHIFFCRIQVLGCWEPALLTDWGGKEVFCAPSYSERGNVGFGRRLVTVCRLGPRAMYYCVGCALHEGRRHMEK